MNADSTSDVERLFERWAVSFDELRASIRDAFADGAEWYAGPPPVPVTHGAEEALALLNGFNAQYDLTTIEVDVLRIGRVDDVVYTERVDHLVDAAGKRFLSIPLAGVMKLDGDGRIAYWRDYWDTQEFLALAASATP
jgi:limonene-1,2-epoxide hydrolase